jgi:hypothetical protein
MDECTALEQLFVPLEVVLFHGAPVRSVFADVSCCGTTCLFNVSVIGGMYVAGRDLLVASLVLLIEQYSPHDHVASNRRNVWCGSY